MNPVRVLLVEDDSFVAYFYQESLSRSAPGGFAVVLATTLAQTRRILSEQEVDVVVLDLFLPDSQGFDTFDALHTQWPELAIVVATGRPDEDIAIRCVRAGAHDFLEKPNIGPKVLARIVRYAAERSLAERERKAERAILKAILESVDGPVFSIDDKFKYTSFNASHARLMAERHGARIEIGDSPLAIQEQSGIADPVLTRDNFEPALRGERSIIHAGQDDRLFEFSCFPVRDPDNRIIGAAVQARDITAEHRAQAALEQERERFRAAAECAGDLIYERNVEDGLAIFHGDVDAKMGHPPGDWPRDLKGFFDHVHPEDISHVTEALSLAHTGVRQQAVYRLRTGDGSWKWWADRWQLMFENGSPTRIIGACTDLTSFRRAEDALARSLATMEALLHASPYAIIAIDHEEKVRIWNPAAEKLFGWTFSEVLGKPLPYIDEGTLPEFRRLTNMVSREDARINQEIVRRHRDGTPLLLNLSLVSLPSEPGLAPGIMAIVEDIREKREMENRLRQQQKLEAIGTLASGVAHEINNPMNGILNYAELLVGQLPEGTPNHVYASGILKEGERVVQIVRELLAFTRREREGLCALDISEIFTSTLALLGMALRKDAIRIATRIAPGVPSVPCRRQQIQQVLLNLLTNARDAVNERFPQVHPDKVIRLSAEALMLEDVPWVRITVEDNGAGVPPDVAERIFDPFFTTKTRDRGTGLGLSISYRIIQEHRGRLWLESEPGNGARFHIDLRAGSGWIFSPEDAK